MVEGGSFDWPNQHVAYIAQSAYGGWTVCGLGFRFDKNALNHAHMRLNELGWVRSGASREARSHDHVRSFITVFF